MKDRFKILAEEYRKAKLWDYLSDSDVFGVKLDDGSIAFCCVMGNSGVHEGLGVYIGATGFRTYLDNDVTSLTSDKKLLFEHMVLFEDIQLTYSENGDPELWCQRRHQVPEPDNCNWDERNIMCQALEACISLSVAIMAAKGDVVAVGFDEYEEYPTKEGGKETILMTREGNGYIFSKITLPEYDTSYEECLTGLAIRAMSNNFCMSAITGLCRLKRGGTLECRLIHYPQGVKDKDDEYGYYPYLLLAVNKGNGFVLKPEMVRPGDVEEARTLIVRLCEGISDYGQCPLQISVPDMATEYFLRPFCSNLQIKLVRERRPLRQLNLVWESLFSDCKKED